MNVEFTGTAEKEKKKNHITTTFLLALADQPNPAAVYKKLLTSKKY